MKTEEQPSTPAVIVAGGGLHYSVAYTKPGDGFALQPQHEDKGHRCR